MVLERPTHFEHGDLLIGVDIAEEDCTNSNGKETCTVTDGLNRTGTFEVPRLGFR